MSIKNIFKSAAKAAIGIGAVKAGAAIFGPTVGPTIGKALSSSLMSKGSGCGAGDASGAYVPRSVSLSQFGMGTYEAGAARSTPIKQITTNPETILAEWDYRLTQYARKAYVQTRIARSAKV